MEGGTPQKSLAISLYRASGKAYRLLSKLFILPTKFSLRNYILKVPTEAGISQATMNVLKQKVSQMSSIDKLRTLCIGGNFAKTHLFYSIAKALSRFIPPYCRGCKTLGRVRGQAMAAIYFTNE